MLKGEGWGFQTLIWGRFLLNLEALGFRNGKVQWGVKIVVKDGRCQKAPDAYCCRM